MKSPRSFFASLFGSRVARKAVERARSIRRSKKFMRDALLDLLEERQLLATFTYNSGTGLLAIESTVNNESFTILSSSNNGNYTITSSVNFSGVNTTGLTGTGSTSLIIGSDIANLTNIQITNNAANSGSSLRFLNSPGNFVDNLSVNFTNSTTGTITVANAVSFTGGASLSLTTSTNVINVTSPISANNSGSITFNSRNIVVSNNITTDSGDIALYGNGGGVYQTGGGDGVCISGSCVTSVNGNISLFGRGLASGWSGVALASGGQVNITGTGVLTVEGVMGGGGTNIYGVFVPTGTTMRGGSAGTTNIRGLGGVGSYTGSSALVQVCGTISTGGSNLTIVGQGNTSTSAAIISGVVLDSGTIRAGGMGNVSVTGIARFNQSASGQGPGVKVQGTSPTITSAGGDVLLTGYGNNFTTAGSNNRGILINSATALITSGGNGNVTVIGYGGSASVGDNVGIYLISGKISANGTGNVNVTGTAGSSLVSCGVYITSGGNITSSGGNVNVTGFGGNTTGYKNYGVCIDTSGSMITAGGSGAVNVNGTGGMNSTVSYNFGVYVNTSALITSNNGPVSVTGTGGGRAAGSQSNNTGVIVDISACITSGGVGSVTVTGYAGGLTAGNNTGLEVFSKITSGGMGSVTLTGTGGLIPTNGNYGVFISGASANVSSGGGDVLITGYGGGNSGNTDYNQGVVIINNPVVTSGGSGNMTVTGYGGGNGTGTNNNGVYIPSGSITSGGSGSVIVSGTGSANSSGANNHGVYVTGSGNKITSGGAGSVTVVGQGGGTGSARNAYGVWLASSACITSGGGALNVTGTGGPGSGVNNHGVVVDTSTQVTSTNNVTITATGGTRSGSGLYNAATISTTGTGKTLTITAPYSNITVNPAIFHGGGTISTTGGAIDISANSMTISAAVTATASGNVTVRTLGTSIGVNLGNGTDTTANLGISQAELNQITACIVTIGSSTTGPIVNTAAISRTGNMVFVSSGTITQSGGNLSVTGMSNFVAPGSGVTMNNATNNFGTVAANGTDVTIVDSGAVILDRILATNLTVNAGGAVTQSGPATVTTSANFTTSGVGTAGNITLNNATNNFYAALPIAACGTNVTIFNANATLLGTISGANLTVNSTGGAITQAAGTNLTVPGTANLVATGNAITLSNLTNNLTTLAASGGVITVNQTSSLILGAISTTGGLTVTGDTSVSCISVTGPVSATGSAVVSLTGRNIAVTGNMTTANGDIRLYGNGGGVYQTGSFRGVSIIGPNVSVSSTSGNITIDGRGGLNSSELGIFVSSAAVQTGGNGLISLTGVSGNGSAGSACGIFGMVATISTVNGKLSITGTGCGTTTGTAGIVIQSSPNIRATGSGSVLITGTAACGTNSACGINLAGSNISTAGGSLTLTGTSLATGTTNRGVVLSSSARVFTTGTGSLAITGNAAAGTTSANGLLISNANTSTVNGAMVLRGTSNATGANSSGISVISSNITTAGSFATMCLTGSTPGNLTSGIGINLSSGNVSSAGTPITLTANSVNITGPSTVNATTAGQVTIQTLGANVSLGGPDDSANLGLTQAELNQITANMLTIGSGLSATQTLATNLTWPTNLTIITNTVIVGTLSNSNRTLTIQSNNITATGFITVIKLSLPIYVTNSNDSGSGSLRQAVDDSNADVSDNTIYFDPSLTGSTILLLSPININDANSGLLTITGLGQSDLTISGGGATGLFNVYTRGILTDMTLTSANGSGLQAGGAIYANASLELDNLSVLNSTALLGGSLYQNGGDLSLNFATLGNELYVTGGSNMTVFDGSLAGITVNSGNVLNFTDLTQDLTLGTVNANSLSASITGGILQVAGTSVNITGAANFVTYGTGSAGNIILANATNNFGSVAASGTNINITNAGSLTLGNISGNGTVQFTAPNMTLGGTINATMGGTVVLALTGGTTIDLGTRSAGNFGLTQAELNNITARTLVVGSPTSGPIVNTAPIDSVIGLHHDKAGIADLPARAFDKTFFSVQGQCHVAEEDSRHCILCSLIY